MAIKRPVDMDMEVVEPEASSGPDSSPDRASVLGVALVLLGVLAIFLITGLLDLSSESRQLASVLSLGGFTVAVCLLSPTLRSIVLAVFKSPLTPKTIERP